MLVLSRKKDQVIVIGDDIRLKVMHIGKSAVRFGIEAPENVKVNRGEVYALLQEELSKDSHIGDS